MCFLPSQLPESGTQSPAFLCAAAYVILRLNLRAILDALRPVLMEKPINRKGRPLIHLGRLLQFLPDAEIGELLNVVRTTVFRHRKSALAKIKQYLEGKADEMCIRDRL